MFYLEALSWLCMATVGNVAVKWEISTQEVEIRDGKCKEKGAWIISHINPLLRHFGRP